MVDSKVLAFLKDWMMRYIKNKDIITKKIVSMNEFEDGFHVLKKDQEQKFFILPFLNDLVELEEIKKYEQNKAVVIFHTKENYDEFIKNWKKFVEIGRKFTVYFVNPFSKLERVLIISPYTHDLISDADSLERGLRTMSESVEYTTDAEIKRIIET
jgi:hypothetical protein